MDVDTDFCAMCGHDWCAVRISKEISMFVSGKDDRFAWDKPRVSDALSDGNALTPAAQQATAASVTCTLTVDENGGITGAWS